MTMKPRTCSFKYIHTINIDIVNTFNSCTKSKANRSGIVSNHTLDGHSYVWALIW